jgi:hypothetical protein
MSEEEQATIVTRHATQYPSDPSLQREKLSLLSNTAGPEIVRKAFKESMKYCLKPNLSPEDKADVIAIYTGYLEWESDESTLAEVDGIYKRVLRETLRQDCIPELHGTVLASYYEFLLSRQPETTISHIAILEPIITTYSPSHEFYQRAFDIISTRSSSPEEDLKKVYMRWRASARSNSDKVGATLQWADWLMENGEGKKAYDAVDVMRREVRGDEAAMAELEAGWIAVMEDANGEEGSSDGESGSGSEGEGQSDSESEEGDGESEEEEDEDVIME